MGSKRINKETRWGWDNASQAGPRWLWEGISAADLHCCWLGKRIWPLPSSARSVTAGGAHMGGFCSQAGQMVLLRGAAGSACRCPAGEGHYFVTDMPRSLRGAKSRDKLPVILLAFHCWQVFLTLQLLGVTQGYIHLQLNHINKTTPVRCRLYSRCRKSKCLSKCTLIYQ